MASRNSQTHQHPSWGQGHPALFILQLSNFPQPRNQTMCPGHYTWLDYQQNQVEICFYPGRHSSDWQEKEIFVLFSSGVVYAFKVACVTMVFSSLSMRNRQGISYFMMPSSNNGTCSFWYIIMPHHCKSSHRLLVSRARECKIWGQSCKIAGQDVTILSRFILHIHLVLSNIIAVVSWIVTRCGIFVDIRVILS